MNRSAQAVTVVVVDDHTLVRQGLCEILDGQRGLEVVGEAEDGADAIALTGKQHPGIVLLDVELPGEDVTATVRRLREVSPASRVIIVTMHESPELLQRVLAAGVNGFLLKTARQHDLVAAIRSVALDAGRVVVDASPDCLTQEPEAPGGEVLSTRERQILEMVGEACSNRQIARRLEVSEATVKRHMRNVFEKLGAVSRIDAVNKAVAARLIPPPTYSSSPCRGARGEP